MQRFGEIDLLRGVAIVLMVIFHAGFDLDFYELIVVNTDQGVWRWMAYFVQIVFVGTTGMTLAFSYERGLRRGRVHAIRRRLMHAAMVFSWGMVITLSTWIMFEKWVVVFGILHFLGVSMVLALPLLFLKRWIGLVGVLVLFVAWFSRDVVVDFAWGIPFGFVAPSFYALDYFPLFPWFGLFLVGVAGGFHLSLKKRAQKSRIVSAGKKFQWLGRHSLMLYLAHQPILVALIMGWRAIVGL